MNLRNLLEEDEINLGDVSRYSVKSAVSAYTKPVIGLSRDVLIKARPDHVKNPSEVDPIVDALKAVALIRSKGYKIVIFSNQYGIGERKLSQVDVDVVHQHLLKLLGEAGCMTIEGLYYSTTKLKEDIYALPNIGMLQRAEKETKVKFSEGWFVGDKISDLKAAQTSKAKPILIKSMDGEEALKKLGSFANQDLKRKVTVFETLLEFAESLE
jgi:D-glycero-D-manno-heptose 1,7-bisphosphate phosphatase